MTAGYAAEGSRHRRGPQYQHASELPGTWPETMANPASWRIGHWAWFLVFLTFVADVFMVLNFSNLLGIDRRLEVTLWLLAAGILGFAAIVVALYGIVRGSGRTAAVFALIGALIFGAVPAWLVGNTIFQFVLNGFTLPAGTAEW